ncbi:cytochrome C oxidase subunit IV family protein [Azospirillum picis]|uniref:Cytochrome c oxidase subunit IV n=1 Tax=Azospirillum picis TaxID=488438 RepID=A0ABU0MLM4_9PROT|nr:cytochrome C oxidase subunit IV family protein [Azospirillum picis]MBP2301009.1 hypothetical protein [Azospirillum picis]MDQ0534371.1 hypothetical protein [Azospirillum picis]
MRFDRLTLSWFLLLGLSAVTLLFARHGAAAGAGGATGITGAALLLALAVAKGREILLHYLELAGSPAWARAFTGALAALAGAILLVYAAGQAGWIGPGGTP